MYNNLGLLGLRLAVGIIFYKHSLPKLKNYKMMAQGMGMPAGFVLLLGLVEFLSSLGLALGVYPQAANVLLAVVMAGAMYFKIFKWKVPFMAMDKMGWEFDLVLFAANLAMLAVGPGAFVLLK